MSTTAPAGAQAAPAGSDTSTGLSSAEPQEGAAVAGAPRTSSAALGRYHPGLDGMRAVGMLFMLAYHAELPFARGAFLALSMFFTLSGFLIASMLLRAHDRGGIDLRQFWVRRFERLMPAALLCLAGVVLFGATVATREQAAQLPGQVFAAATYWSNWFFVITDRSYVNLFAAPSPVQHFWSLSVEEQFYVIMPIGMLLLLARSRSARVVGGVFAGGALLSTAWMVHLYRSGAGLDRIYYGTDTRMSEMLVGALLAVIVVGVGERFGERARRTMGGVGFAAFVASVWAYGTVGLADGAMWRGGLLVYSVVTCAVILGVTSQRGPLPAVLSWGPLPNVGRISYGLYLYHWPLFLWLTEERTGLDRWPLFALRMAVTFVIATASYHLVEMPIRNGALRRVLNRRVLVAAFPVAVVVLVLGATLDSRRAAPDPLATIRADDTSLTPPLAPGDDVLDLLVVADGSDPAVVDRLVALGRDDDTLAVTLAEPFGCTELVPVEQGRTCGDWAESWPALIADHDPDLVLLYVNDWARQEILRVTGGGVDPVAAAEDVLGRGFDLLSAQGAPVLWATPGAGLAEGIALSNSPFRNAMATLEQRRSDLHHVLGGRLPDRRTLPTDEYAERAAAALIADASLYQRVDRGDLPRVMVLGDSQARSLGYGLERWAAADDRALVWNAAIEGCGFADEGTVAGVGGDVPIPERCRDAVRSWADRIDEFRPDIVIALTSTWDLRDRHLPGWDANLSPGQPAFDAYLVDEYLDAVDTWSAHGARVVWLTAPCLRFDPGPGRASDATFDDTHTDHLNDAILPEVAARRADVVDVFDLDEVLCPGGTYLDEIDGVRPIRVDGVHFSVDGSIWFADTYGERLLELGS